MVVLAVDLSRPRGPGCAGDRPDEVGLLSECRAQRRLSRSGRSGNNKEDAGAAELVGRFIQGWLLVRGSYQVPLWIARPVGRRPSLPPCCLGY